MSSPVVRERLADNYLRAARQALKRSELNRARDWIDHLRAELDFPAVKPWDRRSMAWMLDGIRVLMFMDCELQDAAAVSRHAHEIRYDLVAPTGPIMLPRIASSWAMGWEAELSGDLRRAFYLRSSPFLDDRTLQRIKELTATDPADGTYRPWRIGDATEAALLVDCYTDWIRTVRQVRPPIGSMQFKRAELARGFVDHPIMTLLEHPRLNVWSYRRAYTRLGFEAADRRRDTSAAGKVETFLTLADQAFLTLNPSAGACELARLEQPLIKAELLLAKEGNRHDPAALDGLKQDALQVLQKHGFERRRDFLVAQWSFLVDLHSRH